MNKMFAIIILFSSVFGFVTTAQAEDYIIDTKGMHAAIEFRVNHLGFSLLMVRFNKFKGSFSYDEKNPENNTVQACRA